MSTDAKSSPRLEASAATSSLLAELLADQRRLQTPVADFAARHDSPGLRAPFREMIPLSLPKPGEQYAFEVDLDRCSGCKSCVAACHSLNGLDDNETWRDVGALFAAGPTPYHQTVTSACHHCADPGCLNGCPVLAYEKDPVTGIVRHLDDQCIGCQYCVLKCPYDVPKYNDRLGIVRKCDMCHSRLAVGEAPACVQACPTEAIRIVTVTVSQAGNGFLAAAPEVSLTKPTTAYVSKSPIPADARPADAGAVRVQPAHTPLALMLAATQLGLGLYGGAKVFSGEGVVSPIGISGLALVGAGLAASAAHLGQPLRAWRIFLNLRASWLSREAVVLGLAFPLLVGPLARSVLPTPPWLPDTATAGILLALLGVACSAMIYIDTGRKAWGAARTATLFGGTTLLGFCLVANPLLGSAALLAKLALEHRLAAMTAETQTLLRGPLRTRLRVRLALGLGGAALAATGLWWAALPLVLAGECLERVLFFQSVNSSRMPGVPASR
ncbi:DmsC/YnfH family molybdoenzyme membrane anchor subunit [Nibricoccus sp. IMCC34717]|uniref:DmsC/YnfH family molybdoenzyme membrane anchor subunit n=1 Tax=Nibricoccus sp. IMCC34717 TaxID=3034021 RepID=UPI0038515E9E